VQLIDMAIDDIRRLARDLRPSVLEELGLSAALNWLLDNCIRRDQTTVAASIVDVDRLIAPDAQVVLYRIVQEALTNVAKHSQATHVSLRGDRQGDRLSFVVEDNGKGFDATGALTGTVSERGLGLATMRERARMIGGSLTVWSEARKGTRIAFDVPVWSQEG
jgi:two-component system NarL family sensor kinase